MSKECSVGMQTKRKSMPLDTFTIRRLKLPWQQKKVKEAKEVSPVEFKKIPRASNSQLAKVQTALDD